MTTADGSRPGRAGPVRLDHREPGPGAGLDEVLTQVLAGFEPGSDRLRSAFALVGRAADLVPPPGRGRTAARWEFLATLAAADLTVARVVEPDLDARAILSEAAALGRSPVPVGAGPGSSWGVFASEAPGATVRAIATATGFRLDGVKPWCSLAGRLTHALITAPGPDGAQLFALSLRHPGVRVAAVDWVARGLAEVPSGPIELDAVPATAVGPPGWYLQRPGFWWGGIGVAACWYGGAVGLARTAWAQVHAAQERGRRSDIAHAQLGAVDISLHAARAVLAEGARLVDGPAGGGGDAAELDFAALAQRVRAVVAGAAEHVLRDAGHLLGPAPLAFDEEHARRVADLTVYVRQQHAERDAAALGAALGARSGSPY